MPRTENLTVMFTDIVGFTERTSLQSRAQNRAMLDDHNRLLLPLINRFGGRRIKSIGDALLITFRSPTDAVHCGMALHDALAEYNAGKPEEQQIHIRVAINVGEVRVDARDIYGEAVNVASRVEGLTPPDQIYFTEAVYLAMNKAEVTSLPLGKFKLKGIPEDVNLFQVPPRQVKRLIPGGEDLGAAPGELPFGGMHRMATSQAGLSALVAEVRDVQLPKVKSAVQGGLESLGAPPPKRRLQAWLLALIAVAAIALLYWVLPLTGGTEVIAEDADAIPAAETADPAAPITGEQPATAAAPALDPEAERQRQAQEWLTKGHAAFAENRRRDAVPAYERAVELEPKLQHDAKLAHNLVECLSWASDLAIPVIRALPSPEIIAALSARSAGDDKGAGRAINLLRELGHGNRIDPVVLAIERMESADSCEQKKSAIAELRALRSPRGLPALKSSLGSGIGAWFKNSCFRSEAQQAIKDIEATHPG